MVYNSLYLPYSDAKQQKAVTSYLKNWANLCLQTEKGSVSSMDCGIKLCYCAPNKIEHDFLINMQQRANKEGLQKHTVIHFLNVFLCCFERTIILKDLNYLHWPGDTCKGMKSTICGVDKDQENSRKHDFGDILVQDGLCDGKEYQ